MKKIMESYLFDAILLVVVGVVLIVYPQGSLDFMIRWAGILLLIMGAAKLLLYLIRSESRETSDLVISILQLLCGIIMLRKPEFIKSIVPFVAGLFIAWGAIYSLYKAFKWRKLKIPAIRSVVVLSIITLVVALIAGIYMIKNPAAVSGFVTRLVGIGVLLEGVTMLASFTIREAQ